MSANDGDAHAIRSADTTTPSPSAVADRVRLLLGAGDTTILLGGTGPDGLAVMRFRAALWSDALECYLAELYVLPDLRGQGLGRALMESALDHARGRGADFMDLGTSEDDTVARKLYESLMYVYERDL
jgi:ribosomal protein S18 acetylase RimI-like enzyme